MEKKNKITIKKTTANKKVQEYFITLAGIILLYVFMKIFLDITDNNYIVAIMMAIGINIIAAASLNLATGILGQLALGHAGFMAIGAYTAAIFSKYLIKNTDLPDWTVLILAVMLAGIMAAIFGIAIGIPALRLRGDYLGIVTLGFGEIIRISIYNIKEIGGARPVTGIKNLVGIDEMFILVVLVMTILYLIIRSRHGRAILSIRENEIAAEAVGIPTTFYKIFGFATSAFFAGVAGAALAFNQRLIDPKKFTFMFSVEIFIIVVLGGMGSLTGTVLAAILLGVLNEWLHFIDQFRLVIYSLLLVIMMILRPAGLLGTKEFSLARLVFKLIGKDKANKTKEALAEGDIQELNQQEASQKTDKE